MVLTPLTLRAHRAMMLAMHYQFASAVEGPFGTGKTETIKDLGYMLAKQTYLINPSSDFNFGELLKFMKGIMQSGAFVLIDEFNRMGRPLINYLT
jgi:dynein heavy chain